MKTLVLAVLGVTSFLASGSLALAARPLHTDDAGVIDKGSCEVEGFLARLRSSEPVASESALQLACGFGGDSQVAVAAAQSRTDGERENSLALVGKTGLWKSAGKGDSSALAVSWQLVNARLPSGTWRHVRSGASLLWTAPVADDFNLHANLGHDRDELARRGATTWGVALEHQGLGADKRWMLMAEIYGDDRDKPWWSAGLRVAAIPDKLFIDVAYGRQFAPDRPALMAVGFKAAF